MTVEILHDISSMISIVSFIFSAGFGLAYKGLKNWKSDSTKESREKWGKIDVCCGIASIIFAIVFVIGLGCFFTNNKTHINVASESSTTVPIETITPSGSESGGYYVSNQSYLGAVYSGYVNELYQPNGKGTMKYSNGTEYKGDWVNGIRHGKGVIKYNNGIYEGEWINDKRNGEGIYTWNDGKKYEGTYVDDARDGYGVFYGWIDLTNGFSGTYYGESKNDEFNGHGKFYFDNGDKFEGDYKENRYWSGTYTRKDGSQFEVDNGKPL